jgi:hypothetical protein
VTVIAELTLPVEAFPLGRALRTTGVRVELDRIVPLDGIHVPYLWVAGEDADVETFERAVERDPRVERIVPLDRVDGRTLYRVEWLDAEGDLMTAIREADAVVVEAGGRERWQFRLRFPDHDALASFHTFCATHDVSFTLERVYTPAEAAGEARAFELTPEQREALVLALDRGYFATPREVTLSELAAELDISKQALSGRLRRATEQVLHEAVSSSPT